MRQLYCGSRLLILDRPAVMGIVNLTPDSFSGDGINGDIERAIAHAHVQLEAGADIIDLGAESSRPGATAVSVNVELARLLPVLRALRDCGVPVSVDTTKPEVMRAALAEGASMINDINALQSPGALDAVSGSDCAVCLMHMRGEPRRMQDAPAYDNVVFEVNSFLLRRVREAEDAGVLRHRCWIDPGFGFGKTLGHNIDLFKSLRELSNSGFPVLVGVSRKAMLGGIAGRDVGGRLPASIAAVVVAAGMGVSVVRVHDVAATQDALKVWRTLAPESNGVRE